MELGIIWLCVTVASAGIGIILFTLFIRLLLSPLQITQLRNAKAMQKLQPLVADLRKKHSNDKQALSQATMDLYREHGANPAMGCLPTLLQFPILIGLFYALLHLGSSPTSVNGVIDWAKSACNGHTVHSWAQWYSSCYAVSGATSHPAHIYDLFHAQFLWLKDGLGKPDPYYILPLLAGATQWVQSRMMLTRSSDPQQQTMNTMMNFMPLMIIFFATRYASGLSLYWVTSTLIAIAIQYRITGWGLLPGIQRLRAALPGGGGGTAMAALGPGTGSRAGRQNKSPIKKIATSTPLHGEQVNGHVTDGNGARPPEAGTAGRPRKKANRARGGRGGRRG